MLATMVQLMGEDKAFDYLKALNRNIDQYTNAGAAPAQAAGRGETLVGISFQHDVIDAAKHYKAVKVVSPCEGTGYEIGSMSLIKGARHLEEAKKFYDWALTPEAQALAAHRTAATRFPPTRRRRCPPRPPTLSKIKLIELRLRQVRLVGDAQAPAGKWTNEVKNAPK